jgi:hypothetical protein
MLYFIDLRIDETSPLSPIVRSSTIDPSKTLPPSRIKAKTLHARPDCDTTVSDGAA